MTREGTLRHPSYRGLRADISPEECTGEERRETTKNALREAARVSQSGNGGAASAPKARVPSILHIDGHDLRLTNLEKVIFPEDGYTKADLIRYYLHRNTVRQRLRRIGQLTGAKLSSSDDRLALQLALLGRQALERIAS